MQFQMLCDTYYRLTRVLQDYKPGEQRAEMFSIYVEAYNGDIVAVASNGKILAAERICSTPALGNWHTNIVVTPALIEQCKTEIQYAGKLDIIWSPELKFATIKSSLGYQHPGNGALIFETDHLIRQKWRKLPPEPIKASKGALAMKVTSVMLLGEASPSGEIILPAFFDAGQTVIVRDRYDSDWLGMFTPHLDDGKGRVPVDPAILPLWAEIV